MDLREVSQFPFSKETKRIIDEREISIDDILSSDKFSLARVRGKMRVIQALTDSEVKSIDIKTDDEYILEITSYAYARMLVSAINDGYLIKRYALGEAVRVEKLLAGASKVALEFMMSELDMKHNDSLEIHFTSYLKYSARIKEQEWKLVNREVKGGFVKMPITKINRLIQNAVQDKIECELPLNMPDEIVKWVLCDTDDIMAILNERKKSFVTEIKGDANTNAFPPCIKQLMSQAMLGINIAHSGRFAMVSFLNNAGMSREDIIGIFAKSPDFNESMTSYQVNNICSKGYKCPECATMKMNGHCVENEQCTTIKARHPLFIYRYNVEKIEKNKKFEGKLGV